MAWKPLPLLSERNNTALVTAVISVTSNQFCNDFFLNHNIIALVHSCLKTTQLSGHWDCFGGNKKEWIILTASFQLENVPFSIKLYRFLCNDCNGCSPTIMTHLLLLGIWKRLTQENHFLFCNKYGLFHGFIFLTIKKFLLSYFPFSLSALRGNKILVFHTWRIAVSAIERVRSKTGRFIKSKTLTKTEKLNEAREKWLKEDLSLREEKQNLWENI